MMDEKGNKQFTDKVFRPKHLGDFGTAAILQIVNKSEDPEDRTRDFSLKYMAKRHKNRENKSKKASLETIEDTGEEETKS